MVRLTSADKSITYPPLSHFWWKNKRGVSYALIEIFFWTLTFFFLKGQCVSRAFLVVKRSKKCTKHTNGCRGDNLQQITLFVIFTIKKTHLCVIHQFTTGTSINVMTMRLGKSQPKITVCRFQKCLEKKKDILYISGN